MLRKFVRLFVRQLFQPLAIQFAVAGSNPVVPTIFLVLAYGIFTDYSTSKNLQLESKPPNKSPTPNAVSPGRAAAPPSFHFRLRPTSARQVGATSAVHVARRRWLRYVSQHRMNMSRQIHKSDE